jgi:hypothetical protein
MVSFGIEGHSLRAPKRPHRLYHRILVRSFLLYYGNSPFPVGVELELNMSQEFGKYLPSSTPAMSTSFPRMGGV